MANVMVNSVRLLPRRLVGRVRPCVVGRLVSRSTSSSTSSSTVETQQPDDHEADPAAPYPRRFSSRPHPIVDRIIRVNHAGEFGADRIYAGQAAVLGQSSVGPVIQHMWEQEKGHLELFSGLVGRRRVRPTALLPLLDIAGYVLGAGSALLGKEAAMACTVAVEETIVEHYNSQLRELLAEGVGDEELLEGISQCRDEEVEHKDIGLEHNAEQAPGYETMSEVIKAGCRAAIWMSERV